MKNLIALILVIIFTGCQSEPSKDFPTIMSNLNNEYSAQTAGVALAVLNDTLTIWSGAFGMANIAEQKSMTTNSIINIASVSKVFVATAVMQLAEKGLLEIDDDINKHLPFEINYKGKKKSPITIRHLLTHRSSIIDGKYYDDSYRTDSNYLPLSTWIENYLSEAGKEYSSNNFSEFNPGENWSYSNIGFGLLAILVENVSEIPFELYCEQHIFAPLNMQQTSWKQTKDNNTLAKSYAYFEDQPNAENDDQISNLINGSIELKKFIPIKPYHFPNYPDGLLFTSVEDLSKFAQCILNKGNYKKYQLLNSETINQMFLIQGDANDKQGLCWRFTGFKNIWGHGGDDPGVQTGLYFDRKCNRAMIVIKNSNLGSRTQLVKDLYLASIK